jgi:hypothetical protein
MQKIHYAILVAGLLAGACNKSQAQNWRDKNEGLVPTFIARHVYGEGTSILAVNSVLGAGNQLFHRPDTLTSFMPTASNIGLGAQSKIVKAKGALFIGTTSGLYRSTDNGVTWTLSSGTPGYVYSLYAINDTLYGGVGTGLGEAKMSTDTGQTWVSIGYPGFMATTFVKANGVLYVGSNNGLKYTADNGVTWTTPPFSSGLSGPIITGLASLGYSTYAACSTGVYKTVDDGANWNVVLPKSMFSLTTVDTSLIGGTNNSGIYQSDQSGTDWNTINTGLPFVGAASYNAVNSIAYNSELLIASLQGDSAIYVTSLADLGLHPSTTPPPSSVTATADSKNDVSVYPNPASDLVSINVGNDPAAEVTIEVMDVMGRKIYTTTSRRAETVISVSNLNAGCYLVCVTLQNTRTTRKISIVR